MKNDRFLKYKNQGRNPMTKLIAYPFEIHSKTHSCMLCDELDAIKDSVRSILNTQVGERIMLPEFGSRVKEYLFEGMREETFTLMEHEIVASLQKWEPRIQNIKVTFTPEDTTLYVVVAYETLYYPHQEEVTITFIQ